MKTSQLYPHKTLVGFVSLNQSRISNPVLPYLLRPSLLRTDIESRIHLSVTELRQRKKDVGYGVNAAPGNSLNCLTKQ
jgi:hypothetical protein